MTRYLNRSVNSPVTHYQIEDTYIIIWFGGKSYTYSYKKAGSANVETMKVHARRGSGLSAYITRNARFLYD